MRTLTRILLATSGAALAGLAPAVAGAQNDVTPHLPNVMLLLDTSGSMEFMISPDSNGKPVLPNCSNSPPDKNRWASLVEVLTGSFQTGAFGCQTVQRTDPSFVSEYALPGTTNPYDYNYYLPWNRIYANGCTIGAGNIGAGQDWANWNKNTLNPHTSAGTTSKCIWSGQNNDGILDVFSGLARFGLMTLDSFPDPSTGQQTPQNFDGPSALAGNWSYFHGWRSYVNTSPAPTPTLLGSPNVPAAGEPAGCNTGSYVEVGARNPSAPPWEGPLTGFGPWCSDSGLPFNNDTIQNQILAMRPFGATPIAGLIDDAREFLFSDKDQLPHTSYDFGPYSDMFWQGGCRKTFMILLTDGEPNLDLRGAGGQCDAPTGVCPYEKAEDVLTKMRLTPPSGLGTQSVTTYVVGFAISNPKNLPGGKTSCAQLDYNTDCNPPANATLSDCCALQKLAQAGAADTDPVFASNGGKAHAFFADNAGDLKAALATILSSLVGAKTSRTPPVYSPAGPANAQGSNLSPPGGNPALSYHFAATVNVTGASGAAGPWTGNLQRERYACISGVPTAQAVDPKLGDDYAANLNSGAGPGRQFFTAIGANVTSGSNTVINSDWTMRPNIVNVDGFGTYVTQTVPGAALQTVASFPSTMVNFPAAFGIATTTDDSNCASDFGIHNAPGTCAQYLMNWAIGGTNSLSGLWSPAVSRDPTSSYCTQSNTGRKCSRLGAIYHSTPTVVGPPREFIRDDSYVSYAADTTYSVQPIVLYAATMDGQLHAFKVSASTTADMVTTDSLQNNEMWSFFPPAVLQHLDNNFNSGGANLLDGTPVIADVPGISDAKDPKVAPRFERTANTTTVNWHRVLVASGGAAAAGGFYYALDITDPTKPSFLWQISTDGSGHQLFGSNPPAPVITSVTLLKNMTSTQVPVAILAGGGGTVQTCKSAVTTTATSTADVNDAANNNPSNRGGASFKISGMTPPPLRCWGYSPRIDGTGSGNNDGVITGATLTVVRLDTGEVIAHFMGQDGHNSSASRSGALFVGQPFTAPLTGAPIAYPSDTGQVAQRVYVGDADGQLWRVDLSDINPLNWGVTLAWDSYIDNKSASRDGIYLPPLVTRDPMGNTVLVVATGEQNMLTAQNTDNRLWSLTETPLNFKTSQNWEIAYAPNQGHVVGQMALFNDVLYFSTYQPLGAFPITGGGSGSGSAYANGSGSPEQNITCTAGSGNACANGQANLGAVDYRRPSPTMGLPYGRFGTNIYAGASVNDGSVIFGVSTTELPSCGGSATTSDPYFGTHTQVTNANTSEYRIMWQVGSGSGLTASGVRNEGVQGMQNMTIPPPGQSTRFDSWATIVE